MNADDILRHLASDEPHPNFSATMLIADIVRVIHDAGPEHVEAFFDRLTHEECLRLAATCQLAIEITVLVFELTATRHYEVCPQRDKHLLSLRIEKRHTN